MKRGPALVPLIVFAIGIVCGFCASEFWHGAEITKVERRLAATKEQEQTWRELAIEREAEIRGLEKQLEATQ